MRKISFKKVLFGLSISLVLAMAIGSFALGEAQTPVTPQVASTNDYDTGAFDVEGGTAGTDYDYANGVLSIHPQSSDTSFEIKNKDPETETKDRIEITAGPNDAGKAVNITLNGVNINTYSTTETNDAAFKIAENAEFNVNVILADNSKNYLTSDFGYTGLEKSDDKTEEADIAKLGTLTIGVPSDSTAKNGMLEANGSSGAGIGGGRSRNGSKITITGGNVTATGTTGAGIGGGSSKDGRKIKISGGKVTAKSLGNNGMSGAGIGGGGGGNGTEITISGGEVIANSKGMAAGIGGGFRGNGTKITINNSTVTATGATGGAGIGGGIQGNGSEIEITGGLVKAFGGFAVAQNVSLPGAGIGGGAEYMNTGGEGSKNSISGNAFVFAASGGEYEDGTKKEALQGFDSASQGSIADCITFIGVGIYDPTTFELTGVNWEEGTQYGNVTITEDTTFPANFKITSDAALTIGKNAAGKEATLSMAEGKKLTVEGSLINEGVIDIPTENIECSGTGEITTLLNYDPQGGEIVTTNDEYITYQNASGVQTYGTMPSAEKDEVYFDGWYSEKKGEGTKVDATSNVLLNSHVLYANWTTEPGPEPTPTPPTPTPPGPGPEPTPDPSVDPDGGDGSGSSKTGDPFMGGMALALLGVATTGAVLVRKRK